MLDKVSFYNLNDFFVVNILTFHYYNSYLDQTCFKGKWVHLRAEHEEVNNQTKNKGEQRNFVPDRFHYKGNLLHVKSVEAIKKKIKEFEQVP